MVVMNRTISLLNKVENQLLAVTIALLVFGGLSYANSTTEKISEIIYSKPVIFKEFRDPS